MLGTIYRSGVMSDIYHSGVQFNLAYKFCSYTTNTTSQSADIKLSLPAGKKITIYWGDGASTVITGAVTKTTYSHTYIDVKTYNLTVSGDYNDISWLQFIGDGSYGGNIKYLPDNLTYLLLNPANTFTGDVINLPINLNFCYISGQNTVFGDIQNLQNISIIYIAGNNVLYGDLNSIGSLTSFFTITGKNTISEYTGKTWTTNMSNFKLVPVSPGGLSSSEIDQLLIDLDEDLDWSGGGTITLTGTNASRTSASDAAVNNIIAEGGTVITNN